MVNLCSVPSRGSRYRLTSFSVALLAVAFVVGWGRVARARDLVGTRAIGMGGALRAAALGPSSVLLNPAGMSLARMYVTDALYQYRGSDSASQLSASVVDSTTSRHLGAGLFYNFGHASPKYTLPGSKGPIGVEETRNTHEIGGALSMALGQFLTFGVLGRYINVDVSLNDGAPEGLSVPDISAFTMDVGGIIRLGKSFNVAIVGYNLIPVDHRFSALYPQTLGLGVSYAMGTLLLAEFDTVLDFSSDPTKDATASFHGGVEALFAKRYVLRAGVAHDMRLVTTYVSGGVGIVTRRVGVEVALRQMVAGGPETLFAASVKVFLK
ncbi:MAG: hypothetical protein KAI47_21950 [Deltaproteobacteria bacterium]|nr:hypothetical protein [Deltaproteobacteria bacterium]